MDLLMKKEFILLNVTLYSTYQFMGKCTKVQCALIFLQDFFPRFNNIVVPSI